MVSLEHLIHFKKLYILNIYKTIYFKHFENISLLKHVFKNNKINLFQM